MRPFTINQCPSTTRALLAMSVLFFGLLGCHSVRTSGLRQETSSGSTTQRTIPTSVEALLQDPVEAYKTFVLRSRSALDQGKPADQFSLHEFSFLISFWKESLERERGRILSQVKKLNAAPSPAEKSDLSLLEPGLLKHKEEIASWKDEKRKRMSLLLFSRRLERLLPLLDRKLQRLTSGKDAFTYNTFLDVSFLWAKVMAENPFRYLESARNTEHTLLVAREALPTGFLFPTLEDISKEDIILLHPMPLYVAADSNKRAQVVDGVLMDRLFFHYHDRFHFSQLHPLTDPFLHKTLRRSQPQDKAWKKAFADLSKEAQSFARLLNRVQGDRSSTDLLDPLFFYVHERTAASTLGELIRSLDRHLQQKTISQRYLAHTLRQGRFNSLLSDKFNTTQDIDEKIPDVEREISALAREKAQNPVTIFRTRRRFQKLLKLMRVVNEDR